MLKSQRRISDSDPDDINIFSSLVKLTLWTVPECSFLEVSNLPGFMEMSRREIVESGDPEMTRLPSERRCMLQTPYLGAYGQKCGLRMWLESLDDGLFFEISELDCAVVGARNEF